MKKFILPLIIALAFFLRFYQLGQVPPSLYWDETSLGYNAFAISQTLRDEHGVFLPLTNFAAFGDYKPVGYIYAAVPFIKLLGLTEVAVRLPSALAGVLLTLVTFFLVKQLSFSLKTALVAAFFVAISPWSLQMSRGAFEANLATFFSAAGVLFFLRKSFVSAIFFTLSMYTFNTHRIFVPLLVASLSLIYFSKKSLLNCLLLFILVLPLISHMLSDDGKLRFQEVTWLNDLSLVEESNQLIASNNNAVWAKLIFNRRIFYAREFLIHYIDHFRFDYLFGKGDINSRLSTRSVGELWWLDLPLILVGGYILIRRRDKTSVVLFSWLTLSLIPAAMARETPHALRTLNLLPVPMIISAVGLVSIPKLLRLFSVVVIPILFLFYMVNYYCIYPVKFAGDWQFGYKQMVNYVSSIEKNYDYVQVTNHYGRPYIYFLFYNQYPPEKYWNNRIAFKDQFGFWTVNSFDRYIFDGSLPAKGKVLFVKATNEQTSDLKLIKSLDSFNIHE